MNLRGSAPRKKWPLYCFYAAVGMLMLAGILYFIYCQHINSEYGNQKAYFGEQFDELYALTDVDEDIVDGLLAHAKDAMKAVGDTDECAACRRYCINPESYPDAVRVEAYVASVAAGIEDDSGYLWVEYWQMAYDENGELVTASGSEEDPILSRWSLMKTDGQWKISEIKEHP